MKPKKKKTGLRYTPALAKALQALKGKHPKPPKTWHHNSHFDGT